MSAQCIPIAPGFVKTRQTRLFYSPHQPIQLPGSHWAVEFEDGSSCWGADGSLHCDNLTTEKRRELQDFTSDFFGTTLWWFDQTHIIMSYDPRHQVVSPGTNPSPANHQGQPPRPFAIAGLLILWRLTLPLSTIMIPPSLWAGPNMSIGEAPTPPSPPTSPSPPPPPHPDPILAELAAMTLCNSEPLPSRAAILHLADHVFPGCAGLAIGWGRLVVELPATGSAAEFQAGMWDRQRWYRCISQVTVFFHNGPVERADLDAGEGQTAAIPRIRARWTRDVFDRARVMGLLEREAGIRGRRGVQNGTLEGNLVGERGFW